MNSPSATSKNAASAISFLKKNPLFAELGADVLNDIAARLQYRTFGAGVTLFHQDMPGMTLYMIDEGYVRMYSIGQTGQEFSYYVYGPSEIFGELSLLDDGFHAATCITMMPAKTWLLHKEQLFEVLQKYPVVALKFLRLLANRVRSATRKTEAMAFQDVQGRLAYELLAIAKNGGKQTKEGFVIEVSLNQNDLASMVGATRESVNKALALLRTQELIKISDTHTFIIDKNGLEKLLSERGR